MSENETGLCVPMNGEKCEGMALALKGRNGGRGFDKITTVNAGMQVLTSVVVYRCNRAALPMLINFCPWCGVSYLKATEAAIEPCPEVSP